MKRILFILVGLIFVTTLMSQVPQTINYQAVVRNHEGEVIANSDIDIKMEIVTSDSGVPVYAETHNVTTNAFGLINLRIGTGETTDQFDNVDWAAGSYTVRTSVLESGNYEELGVSQLSAVPYAFMAADTETKQQLSIDGNEISLTDGGSVQLPATFDGDYNNLSNAPINVSYFTNDAGYITDELDGDPTNEIQDLQLIDDVLTITNNANATEINLTAYTGSNTDEQTLSLDGTTLTISNGNNVDLSVVQDGVDDADADPTNEIQTLSIADDVISLTSGGSVTLPATFSGDYNDLINAPDLTNYDDDVTDDFSGDYNDLTNKPTLTGDVSGDLGANTVEKIRGRDISSAAPADGQVLKWNNTTGEWIPGEDELGAAGSTDGVVSSVEFTGTTTKTITLNRSNSLASLTATFTDEVTDADADPTNEIQDISLSGTELSISDGSTIELAVLQDGYEANTDDQQLSISGTTLSLEDGGSVDL
ncbi:MAG: hypothetical protein R6U85_12075, partial [Salinivirgaceae bacterium]